MTAVNFLWNPGTSNDGLLQAAIVLMHGTGSADELYGLATGGYKISSTSGASGVFTNAVNTTSGTSSAVWCEIFLTLGAVGTALGAGANLTGWFLTSYNGGTNFEDPNGTVPVRSGDFYIPLPAGATVTSGSIWKASTIVQVPSLKFKVGVQNNSGQTFSSDTVNYLRLAPCNFQTP